VTVYRLVRRKFADLSGEGARLYGGRFNPPGIPAIYTSESIALALLEVLVHVDKSEVPNDYAVMAIRFEGRHLRQWRAKPGATDPARLTAAAFRSSFYQHPVVRIPSVIVPREHNYVLLPEAKPFHATVDWVEPLDWDRRLFPGTAS